MVAGSWLLGQRSTSIIEVQKSSSSISKTSPSLFQQVVFFCFSDTVWTFFGMDHSHEQTILTFRSARRSRAASARGLSAGQGFFNIMLITLYRANWPGLTGRNHSKLMRGEPGAYFAIAGFLFPSFLMFHLSRISSCSWVRESEKNGKDGWTKNSYISYRLSEAVMFGKRLF